MTTSDVEVVHIAGIDVCIDTLLRQRCGWCGAMLLSVDLANIQHIEDDTGRHGVFVWGPGDLVGVSGGSSWFVENSGELPDRCCGALDPDVTI